MFLRGTTGVSKKEWVRRRGEARFVYTTEKKSSGGGVRSMQGLGWASGVGGLRFEFSPDSFEDSLTR